MKKISAALDLSLKNLAAYGSLRFTPRQLYYETCRRLKKPKGLNWRAATAVLAAGSLPAVGLASRKTNLSVAILAANALAGGGLLWLRKTPHTLAPPISFKDFENALENYLQNHQRPVGLLAKINDEQPSINYSPIDLPWYGLPRLLVCQSGEIAQMLRANSFHLEASCAVLSLKEASPLHNIFREMMLRAGQSRVFFLHDASFAAFSILPDLRERLEIPESASSLQILGLRPAHAERLHLFIQQGESVGRENLETLSFLSDVEKCWLANGLRAEVAAVNPVRLLRVLRRLVSGASAAQNSLKFSLPPRELGFM